MSYKEFSRRMEIQRLEKDIMRCNSQKYSYEKQNQKNMVEMYNNRISDDNARLLALIASK